MEKNPDLVWLHRETAVPFEYSQNGKFHTLLLQDPVVVKPIEIVRAFEIPTTNPDIARTILAYVAYGAQAWHHFCSRVTPESVKEFRTKEQEFRKEFPSGRPMVHHWPEVKLDEIQAATMLLKM